MENKSVMIAILLVLSPIFFTIAMYPDSFSLSWNQGRGGFLFAMAFIAAELIEKSGCKGLEYGDAIVSDLHSNFLINKGRASAADIENLGKKIIEKVFNKFNILLDWEIKLVGE